MTDPNPQHERNETMTDTNAEVEPTEETTPDDSPNREAAKYRRQLRATEAERDQLRERVEGFQRAEVERIAGATVSKPEALWAAGLTVADLLTDDGEIDPEKVKTATVAASERLGLTRSDRGPIIPGQGAFPDSVPHFPRFSDAFSPDRH